MAEFVGKRQEMLPDVGVFLSSTVFDGEMEKKGIAAVHDGNSKSKADIFEVVDALETLPFQAHGREYKRHHEDEDRQDNDEDDEFGACECGAGDAFPGKRLRLQHGGF